ncbi:MULTISPECIES: hypothetical protein [Clostridium]|uniref:hypothetical protein n=1 Tax=Clostridium TaxID=1485 RepID=UPI001FA7F58D|nr:MULTISPECIES: hypothetical protein [Clostridium]
MSDKVIFTAIICITILAMTSIVFIATYMKDSLTFKNKMKIKDIAKTEIEVTAKNRKSKK